jgi:2-polyprenyl-3-methyl-5-hydroxy-6-metoxy-1,4-benzoquinol methylase
MRLKYLFSFLRTARMPGLLPIMMDWRGVLRFHFLYAAIESGLLEALRMPCSRIDLQERLGSKRPEILAALLKVGVAVKELNYKNGQYRIKGKRSRAMIGEHGDMLSAIVQANVTYYNSAYRQAADRMQGASLGEDLNDVGDIVARFSKLSDPVMQSFFSDILKRRNGMHILDIGCGSGLFLKTAHSHNPDITGIGIDVDIDAANQAIRNMRTWGLEDKFSIIKGDFRSYTPDTKAFDLISLINVVYYFSENERSAIFSNLRSKLASGGSLAIVMNMQGKDKDAAAANLNLVNASLKGVTLLPDPEKLRQQLLDSGFKDVQVSGLMPGSSFIGMQAR